MVRGGKFMERRVFLCKSIYFSLSKWKGKPIKGHLTETTELRKGLMWPRGSLAEAVAAIVTSRSAPLKDKIKHQIGK